MNFSEYQKAVMITSGPAITKKEAIVLSALGICGEGGEVADLIKKHLFHCHDLPTNKLQEELGDVLWYIARMCNALNLSMEHVALMNIFKLKKRYPNGFSSERSINREE